MSDATPVITLDRTWTLRPIQRGYTDIALYHFIKDRAYIAGSYAAWMGSPLDNPIAPGDIDLFAVSTEAALSLKTDLLDIGYELVIETDIAYTLHRAQFRDLQIVKPHPDWTTFPADIIASFDFDICRAVVVSDTDVLGDPALGTLNATILRVTDPLRCLTRILKYSRRGVHFAPEELVKVLIAWQQLYTYRQEELVESYGIPKSIFPWNADGPTFEATYDPYFTGEH